MNSISTYYPEDAKFVSSGGVSYEVGHYDEEALLLMVKASELVEGKCSFKEFVESVKINYQFNYKEGIKVERA